MTGFAPGDTFQDRLLNATGWRQVSPSMFTRIMDIANFAVRTMLNIPDDPAYDRALSEQKKKNKPTNLRIVN